MRMRVKQPKALALATSAVYEIVMIGPPSELVKKNKDVNVGIIGQV